MAQIASDGTPAGHLLKRIDQMISNQDQLAELAETLSPLKSKLPFELFEGEECLDLESGRRMREILSLVKQGLLPQLFAKGDGQ